MSAYTTFLCDPQRVDQWLVEFTARDPDTGSDTTLYFSLRQFGTDTWDTPASQQYDARLVDGLRVSSGTQGLEALPLNGLLPARVGGTVSLAQFYGDLDDGSAAQLNGYPMREWTFGGRNVVVRHGGYSPRLGRELLYEEYRVFNYVCDGEPIIGLESVEFLVKPRESKLDSPFEQRRFYGTHTCGVFNGTSARINFGNHAIWDFTSSDFTVSFLIYIEAYPAGTAQTFIGKGSPTVDGWNLQVGTTGRIRFNTYQSGATQTSTSGVVPLYKWVRVVMRRSASSGVAFYVDGDSSDTTIVTHTDPVSPSTRNLYIGCNNGVTNFFVGALDDIRIWNDFRTASEIDDDNFGPLEDYEIDASLVLYAKLDDGEGATSAADSSGYANDGAITDVVIAPSCQGRDDITGVVMPNIVGLAPSVIPVPVDIGTQTFVIHTEEVSSIGKWSLGGDDGAYVIDTPYSSWLTFVTSTPPVDGHAVLCSTPGWSLVRLGGVPNYPFMLVDVQSETGGVANESASPLLRWLVCNKGDNPFTDPDDLDTDSFDDLETAAPQVVGRYYDDEVTVGDVANDLLTTVGAGMWVGLSDGLLRVRRNEGAAAAATPTVTLSERNVADLRPLKPNRAIWEVIYRFRENQRPHSFDEVIDGDVMATDNPAYFLFLRNQWSQRPSRSRATLQRFKDSPPLIVESLFRWGYDAKAEAVRTRALHQFPDIPLSMLVTEDGFELDRFDCVYVDYKLFNRFNVATNRLGTSSTEKFLVLSVEPDAQSGKSRIVVWRERTS